MRNIKPRQPGPPVNVFTPEKDPILLRLHADDSRFDEMLPDRWAADHPEMVLSYRLEESRQKAARQRDRRRRRARRRPK